MTQARDFEGFYAENFRVLTTQLYAYCGNLTDAQDVVQEACLRALARWPQLSEYEDPVGWVRRVAWNLATSQWRKARRVSAWSPADSATGEREGERVQEPTPDRVDLVAALAELPTAQRQAIVMHYLGDLSVSEIAELSQVPTGTVKSWMARARATLSAKLSVGDTAIPYARAGSRGQEVEAFTQLSQPGSADPGVPMDLGIALTDPLAGLFDNFAADIAPHITVPEL